MSLVPQRNFTDDLILGASMRASVCFPLSQAWVCSHFHQWCEDPDSQEKESDSQWLSNSWSEKAAEECQCGVEHSAWHVFCEDRLMWGPSSWGAHEISLYGLSEMPSKSYRHPHGHFSWGSWDDSLLKVLASRCHKPAPAEQSKESTR